MCGITGFVARPGLSGDPLQVLRAMNDAIVHRGPDADGLWSDADAGVFLGHRRLSIIDLSPAGAQPMVSCCGRWVLCYNGELYNTPELRDELDSAGQVFRGSSDTEVLLAGIACWGVRDALRRLNGMFAFAAWDRQERTLHLARDRLGIKPLYWGEASGSLLFASELSAFNHHPAWRPELDREAITLYMRYGYVPAPRTIWRQAQKLVPGHHLVWREGDEPRSEAYWAMETVVRQGRGNPWRGTPEAAVDELHDLLADAVGRQMVSDVPLGAFLSGGIDSSTVVALMQAQSGRPVKTFSIGFKEQGYDEAQHARAVARHLGTEHHELYVAPKHAREVLPDVAALYDEPFADSSQIPTYLVSQLARGDVTVTLSGDGGDECFAGYSRYPEGLRLWQEIDRVPGWLRRSVSGALQVIPEAGWDGVGGLIPARWRPQAMGMRVHRLARRVGSATAAQIYTSLLSQWHQPEQLVVGAKEPMSVARDEKLVQLMPDMLDRMQYIDTVSYLPDDILTKVDRASMGVSLESRVPLLDHRVVEFAWRLPPALRRLDGEGKWPLRQVLYRYVPRELVDRPKMGFGVPIDAWLRGPLKEWAWSLLSPNAVARHGVLRPGPIQAAWDMHQSGEHDLHYPLWTVLMLHDWLDRQDRVH